MSSLLHVLLWPFSMLYGVGVYFRNKLFDWKVRKSVSFELPVITIGNLSAGGTGKTPQAEYLIRLLQDHYVVGLLSRGYRRKTRGFFFVDADSTAAEAGDEALQIKRKFPATTVAVCEDRVLGIPNMLAHNSSLQVIILDDAFQHRNVNAGLNILLTEYSKPYSRDSLLPAGRLREPRHGAKRADIIIVTKCPETLSTEEKKSFEQELEIKHHQHLLFSSLQYGPAYNIFNPQQLYSFEPEDQLLLFCGIANPQPLINHLEKKSGGAQWIRFADHHAYSLHDLKKIQAAFLTMKWSKKILVTTEKDAVRLLPFRDWLLQASLTIYCVPVETVFSSDEKNKLDALTFSFVKEKISASNGEPAE